MSSELTLEIEALKAQRERDMAMVAANFRMVTENMRAFAEAIQELKGGFVGLQVSQQSLLEAQRSMLESQERTNRTVEILAQENRQIWEYLMRERPNGSGS